MQGYRGTSYANSLGTQTLTPLIQTLGVHGNRTAKHGYIRIPG